MELIIYTPNMLNTAITGAFILTMRTNGVFHLSQSLGNEIGAAADMYIVLAQDPKKRKDWYLALHSPGYRLRNSAEKKSLLFANKPLMRTMISALDLVPGQAYKFLVGSEPTIINEVKYYPIITSSAK